MYLKAGEQELAKEAFTRSRSVDPSLSFTWAAMANMCDSRRQYVAFVMIIGKTDILVSCPEFSIN